MQAGLAPRAKRPASERRRAGVSTQLLDAGVRRERDALAGVVAHPELSGMLAELTPEHFDDELHRRVREHLVDAPLAGR